MKYLKRIKPKNGRECILMEVPEIYRVLGERRPEFVRPYVEQLRQIPETDKNRYSKRLVEQTVR